MRWICAAIIAVCVFFATTGIMLCEGVIHVHPHIRLSTPPAYLRNLDFAWSNAQITTADGAVMKGWFLEPRTPSQSTPSQTCVVVLHGIGDSRVGALGFAPMFLEHGYGVLTPDSRGHGESGGEIVTYGVREAGDVLRWVDWMHTRGCVDVVGLGESLGAAVVLQAAGMKPAFRAVVAECSYASFPAIGEERLARATGLPAMAARILVWPALVSGLSWARLHYGVDLWQVNPAESARRSTTPILLIHGLNDDRTSPDNSRAIAAAAPGAKLWLVPGAGHVAASRTDPVGFEAHLFDFLGAVLR